MPAVIADFGVATEHLLVARNLNERRHTRWTTTTVPQPVITVTQTTPTIPSSTPLGTVVATITVVMSDTSLFTGTLTFGPPNFDDGGIYAITGTSTPFNLIVNPAGPGVGAQGGSVDHVTVVATQ